MVTIRTPDHRLRVFISSTLGELAVERDAARTAIERLRLIPVMFEVGARPHPPRALYRAYLEQSDVFVGIYWQRYGWVAPGEDVSGLEDEYRLAAGRMPQLVYIKEPADGREPSLSALLQRVQQDDRLSYRRFGSADELGALLSEDLAVLLSERFHPLTADAVEVRHRSPLPAPLDRTFGRERDVEAVVGLVRAGHRLLTATGPGGIGKTRLALEAGRALAGELGDAVFVPLAEVGDPALVLPTLAERLGVGLDGVDDVLAEVVADVGSRPMLLVIDNFEQVASAAPELVALLDRCPRTVALVTSRHLLRVRGEREYVVPPLGREASSALLTARAGAARSGFEVADDDRAAVEELALRLDGLPLAIELAAARLRLFSPSSLLRELSRRIDVLSRGATDAPERQRTLRGTMDWSYELLDDAERDLFARLAVFHGGWTLAGAEAVCGGTGRNSATGVLETLAGLVEKSLVVPVDDADAEPRLRMLETVRTYAEERLAALPDRHDVERRHTAWLFELLVGSARTIRPPHHRSWLEQFDQERANLRAAVGRALRDGDVATVVGLVGATIGYLSLRDAEAEADRWLEQATSAAVGADPPTQARLLMLRALIAGALGRYEEAQALIDASRSTAALGVDAFDIAISSMAEAVASTALRPAADALERAVRAAHAMAAVGSDVGEAYMWQTAGTVALSADPPLADRYLRTALQLAEAMANDTIRAQSLTLLGYSARRAGRTEEAHRLLLTAAGPAQASGQRSSTAYALDGLAAVAADLGLPEVAARALGTSEAARSSVDRTAWASFSPLLQEVVADVRGALGDDGYEAARAEGRRCDTFDALRQGLAAVDGAGGHGERGRGARG